MLELIYGTAAIILLLIAFIAACIVIVMAPVALLYAVGCLAKKVIEDFRRYRNVQ